MRPAPAQPYDGSTPLDNPRHERFAISYAGECFGNGAEAYRRSGYKTAGPKSEKTEGSRLLAHVTVMARVRYLRRQAEAQIACDRASLLDLLKRLMDDPATEPRDRIQAAQEFAKLQGYYSADRVDLTSAGQPLVTTIVFCHESAPDSGT